MVHKEEKTADELRQLIQTRLDQVPGVKAGDLTAPAVIWIATDDGPNWDIGVSNAPVVYRPTIGLIVDALRMLYVLPEG